MTAVYGSLARRFGLVPCLVSGVLLVSIGAAAAVLAINLPMLILARVVQGIGAGAAPPLCMALFARRLSGPARAQALGTIVAAVGVGFASGPLVGGLLLEAFGWRGAMALGLLVAPAAAVIWRIDRDRGSPDAPLDRVGIALLSGTVGSLVFLVNRLPILGLSAPVWIATVALVVLGAILVAHSRGRPDAALPLDLFADARLRGAMILGFVGQTAFLGMLVIVPIGAARDDGNRQHPHRGGSHRPRDRRGGGAAPPPRRWAPRRRDRFQLPQRAPRERGDPALPGRAALGRLGHLQPGLLPGHGDRRGDLDGGRPR